MENSVKLPSLADIEIEGKKVLVRADLDVGEDPEEGKERLKTLLPTLKYLAEKNTKVTLLGHRGRPDGEKKEELSLKPVGKILEDLLREEIGEEKMKSLDFQVMENLRFNKGEIENDEEYAKHLAEKGDFYVNEAFASSHNNQASIVLLPKYLPHAAGFHFIKELENLNKIRENPARPLIFIISGIKSDKLAFIDKFKELSDKVLIGGRLPESIFDTSPLIKDPKVLVASLIADKEDISISSIEAFETEIKKAKTIVLSGPLGKFEEEGHSQGTKRVFEAVANSSAFKVAGGGETQKAIKKFNLDEKFDWISVGGGAMLTFLAQGTLLGIKALEAS